VFWHSSAHVLGEAAERHYACHLCIGPPTDDGFFYEMAIENRPVTTADYPALEKVSEMAIKDKQKFERLVVPKETLLEMFSVSVSIIAREFLESSNCHFSTINTRNTSSNRRSLTALPRLSIDVDLWLTSVLAPTSRTQGGSRHLWSPRQVPLRRDSPAFSFSVC
jgi:hypothetical protein